MKNKTVKRLFLALLILCITSLISNVRVARASGTIYILEDGSIDPPTAPIQRVGDLYTFTADIYDTIVVRKSSITIDGNQFKLQGTGIGTGVLTDWAVVLDVTIRNTVITGFGTAIIVNTGLVEGNRIENNTYGIYCEQDIIIRNNVIANNYGNAITLNNIGLSGETTISGNILTRNGGTAISYLYSSSGNWANNTITNNRIGIGGHALSGCSVTGNKISNNTDIGVLLYDALSVYVYDNSIEHNRVGVFLSAELSVSGNRVFDNIIAYNDYGLEIGQYQYGVPDLVRNNFIYHNDFLNNAQANAIVNGTSQINNWDDGYPSGGNFWSDYNGVDLYSGPSQNITGSDGMGDTPYFIAQENVDRYPLMIPYNTAEFFVLRITTTTGGTTNPAPGPYVYTQGTVVEVTAVPEADYIFDYWELDNVNVGVMNPTLITIDTNHGLHAVFKPKPDIAVTSVVPYPTNVRRGQIVYIDVTVANQRFTSETFDVVVYADNDRNIIGDEVIVGVQTIYNLPPGGTKTTTFIWDTSTLPSGTGYYISAKAIVPYDIDPTNNLLTAKKKVSIRH